MNISRTGARPRAGTRRSRVLKAGIACTGLLATVLVPLAATAGTVPPFAIESPALVPNGGAEELEDPEGNLKELGPLNSSTTKIGVIHNDAVPTLGLTNPNGQVDLRRAWLDNAKDTDGDDWLYFAWERDNNTGSGFIAYEFMANKAPAVCGDYTGASVATQCNPWANRAAGDFLIMWDQQGGSKDLYLRTWAGTGSNLTLGAPQLLDANVSDAEYSADGFRGEAALNVTDAIFGGVQRCLTFANVIPSTVTGNSDTADYKDTILQPQVPLSTCEATITTDPRNGDNSDLNGTNTIDLGADGVAAVSDQAVVDISGGSATPAGSVTFFLCEQPTGTCTTGGTEVGSTSIAGGTYPRTVYSPTAYVTKATRYCWRGEYSGDTANGIGPKTESSAAECFTVNPVTPTLSTVATDDVPVGGTVGDTATLSGTAPKPVNASGVSLTSSAGSAATGTITFRLHQKTATGCGSQVGSDVVVNVSGDGAYSVPVASRIQPPGVGTFHWVASYSGDSPNTNAETHNTGCNVAAEEVSTFSVPSSLTSAQKWIPRDTVTVSAPAGTGDLGGTVYFALFDNATCSGTAIFTDSKAVAGPSGATVTSVTSANGPVQDTTGSFSWKVSYDSTNPAQRDIGDSCHETSALTITNGGVVSSTP